MKLFIPYKGNEASFYHIVYPLVDYGSTRPGSEGIEDGLYHTIYCVSHASHREDGCGYATISWLESDFTELDQVPDTMQQDTIKLVFTKRYEA
jgi:hypothetical protein